MPKRVCVVITARPSYSRVKTVLAALQRRPDVTLQVICAAAALVTRYGRIVDQVRADGFPVDIELPSVVDGSGTLESAVSTGLLLTQMAGALKTLRPDMVVTIADRHETAATAVAASYQNIPLCHLQGGEVSGSIDDKVRNAVTQLADLHCVATRAAHDRVVALRPKGEVHVTGCPGIDLAAEALELGPLPGHEVVVLQHAVTDQADQAGAQMRETIRALEGLDALYFWPGEDAGGEAMVKELRLAGIKAVRNRPPVEFLRLLLGSRCLVGNSSVGIRECSFLGVPVVNIGDRQQGRERGPNVTDVFDPPDHGAIRAAVEWWLPRSVRDRSTLYGDGKAGEKIAALVAA